MNIFIAFIVHISTFVLLVHIRANSVKTTQTTNKKATIINTTEHIGHLSLINPLIIHVTL